MQIVLRNSKSDQTLFNYAHAVFAAAASWLDANQEILGPETASTWGRLCKLLRFGRMTPEFLMDVVMKVQILFGSNWTQGRY